ncbi:pyridoxal phosphate-dependent aminotransferase [Alcanivorax marinus]|uniref:Aminotransferase n=1 Tax=Alloalcanivorax marinus TaxID=1177169 RepID=A0A9Q3YNI8_9GAMM|nr:pyridoxal phosphate-dependent aminotransferase [Alloalcanivorax marinus]MCC4309827.1 pyridoxal phosphate-dependent aminotransferase [Alloalcanivorax marinus]
MPFSHRVESIQPSLTLKINAEAAALQQGGERVARLGAGEPDFDTPAPIKEAAHSAIDRGFTHYTAVDGTDDLKAAVREKFRRDNDLDFAQDQVMVTCGAKQALYDLCQTLLGPGDEAVVPRPYWVTYPAQVTLAGAQPVYWDLCAEDDYLPDPDRLASAFTHRTRVVFLNSPNNPTGRVYDEDRLRRLAEVFRRHPQVWVICDDIYEHLNWSGRPFRTLLNVAPDLADRCFVVNGVSKAYAMTGWRVGFLGGPAPALERLKKVQGQSTAGTASISQHAALAALTGDQTPVREMVAEYRRRHDRVVPALDALPGVRCAPSDGTFYAFPDVRELIADRDDVDDDYQLAETLLHDAGVAVVPGSGFGAPGRLRVSFAASQDTIDLALERLRRFIG